jgi:predicted amidophosphoribosyltransferase
MGVLAAAAELLGAPRCEGCGAAGEMLCRACAASLSPAGHLRIRGAEGAVAACAYEGPARALVLRLKLDGARAAADPLVRALYDVLVRSGVGPPALTWVPGRAADMRRRGFDHAETLARGLAHALGLPAAGLLRRVGAPADQAALSRAERRRNLVGAFAARAGGARHVLLIDDLVTTGATAEACVAALQAAGVPRIEVAAACGA